MMVCPLSGSVLTLNVGSSCASLPSATPIFSWSLLVFGSTATAMTGAGNSMDSRMIGMVLVANRVAGGDVLQSDASADVAGVDLGDVFALVGVHLQQAADALRPRERPLM